MARKKKSSLTGAFSAELRSNFDLDKFKEKKLLNKSSRFKQQKWIPLSKAFQEVTSVAGIPMGHISLLRGHSDTGKTTALLEAAVKAQKMGVLPVFIITEMKWNWDYAIQMGFDIDKNLEGFFLYKDRDTLNSIEDVASFILDLMDEQKKGNLPYDLLFLWDSVGSIPSDMSIKSNKNNNEWNAGAMSTQFGNHVNQKITLSRKETSPYTNTLVCTNKVWTLKPESPMGRPKLMNKGGYSMFYDSTFVVTFGNIMSAGTSKIKAIKDGKQVEFAKRTNVQVDKNHVSGAQSRGRLVMTAHGFINDTDKDLKAYKEKHSSDWAKVLGGFDFEVTEESSED